MTPPTRDELAAKIAERLDNGSATRTWPTLAADVVLPLLAERDAEIERLRAFISSGALGVQVAEQIDKLVAERDAWREDADRLAAEILRFDGRAIPDSAWEALAAHDRLKAGES